MAGNKNTDAIRRYAARIRDSDDDEEERTSPKIIIEAMQAGAALATGKHKPMTKDEANEVTPTDPPSRTPAKAKFALAVLDRIQPPWLRVPVILFAMAIAAGLLWRGVALTGLVP